MSKYKLISRCCVNSKWVAKFLANDHEEYCQCPFKCKVKIASTDDRPYEFIVTEEEYSDYIQPTPTKQEEKE